MRIFIVDSQSRARQSMKALLKAWFNIDEFQEAPDVYEVLRFEKTVQPDAVLVNISGCEQNASETIGMVKAKWPAAKIILLSTTPDMKENALAIGADAFVSKNDPPKMLYEALSYILKI
jgi:DNA-binding NarL/FixJ family response regulator